MNRQPLEGLTLYGMKEVYELFRQSYVSKGKHRLPVWIGYNKSSKKEVTVIPLEKRDEQVKIDLITLFQNEERFRFIESRAKDGITFVFLDVLPSEFENIYLNLPVTPASHNVPGNDPDNSKLIISVQNNKKDKSHKQQKQRRFIPSVVWAGAFLVFVVCGISVYLTPSLFAQHPLSTNMNAVTPAASFTVMPVITETYTQTPLTTETIIPTTIAANTIVQTTLLPNTLTPTLSTPVPPDTLTSTPSITATNGITRTETATIVPTRTGLVNELNLCATFSNGARIRSRPSKASDHLGYLVFKQCLWFNARVEISKNEIWVHIAPNQVLIYENNIIIGGWIRSDLVTNANLTTLELITSEPEVGYVILPTPTITPTFTITPTP